MPWAPERRRHAAWRAGAGLLAGLLVAASLPPLGLWPLAFAGVALLAAACSDARARVRLLVGFAAGAGQLGVGLAFTARFSVLGAAVLVAFEAAFVGLACLVAPRRRGALPALAGLLTLAEAARYAWPFGGLPMGGVALGQAGGPLLAVARLGGPLAVAGATFLAGAGLAALARRRSRAAGALALAAVAALGLAGALAPSGGPAGRPLRVALVQGGGPRGFAPSLSTPPGAVLAATLRPTEAIRPGSVDLVVWPEDVVRLTRPLAGSAADRQLGALARHLRATLVAGITEPVGARRFRNELVAWGPGGHVVARFEKIHLVPFGEYVPFRSLVAHVADLADVPRDAIAGHGSGAIATPAGRLALLVSFEDFFTARGRSGVRAGGRVLVLATNTASYASDQVPAQELAASRLQAVAEGRDLVQAATTGYSASVTADGSVVARSSLGRPALLEVLARPRTGATLYDRLGEGPVLLAAAALALGGTALAAGRRAGGPGEAAERAPAEPVPSHVAPAETASAQSASAQPASALASPLASPSSASAPAGTATVAGTSRLKRNLSKSRNLPTHITP